MEKWKTINKFPNYEVSNLGRVKSKDRIVFCSNQYGDKAKKKNKSIILKAYYRNKARGDKHLVVMLYNGSYKKLCSIHRLVAEAFIPNPNNYTMVNQYDKDNRFIKCWNSISEAQRTYGKIHISSCCKGKVKYAGGYIWKYIN